jgi:hypothetical protein
MTRIGNNTHPDRVIILGKIFIMGGAEMVLDVPRETLYQTFILGLDLLVVELAEYFFIRFGEGLSQNVQTAKGG